jgi:FixJ family two-component response regulator
MEQQQAFYIIDSSSRNRAELARLGFDMGHRCEVYGSLGELVERAPATGIALVGADETEDADAADVVAALTRSGCWLPVVALRHDPAPHDIVAAVKAGVLVVLALPLDPAVLSASLARIAEEVAAHGEAQRRAVTAWKRVAELPRREREVLDWLVRGCSKKVIARELTISPRTVEIHRANIDQAWRTPRRRGHPPAFGSGTRGQGATGRLAAEPAAACLDMQVIAMRGVVVGAEYGAKPLAGALVDHPEEPPLRLRSAMPVACHGHAPPVGQIKAGDVDRARLRMSRQSPSARHVAAGVAAHRLHAYDRAAKDLTGRAVGPEPHPCSEPAGERTSDRAEVPHSDLAFIPADRRERHSALDPAAGAKRLVRHGAEARAAVPQPREALPDLPTGRDGLAVGCTHRSRFTCAPGEEGQGKDQRKGGDTHCSIQSYALVAG